MDCKDFWKRYGDEGLNPELQAHLDECKPCMQEYRIECEINKAVDSFEEFKAPERAWANIRRTLEADGFFERKRPGIIEMVTEFLKSLLPAALPLKPAVIGVAFAVLTLIPITYYTIGRLYPTDSAVLQERVVRELEETESEYLAAIEKFSGLIEANKEEIDTELYDLYQDKLAILDEYIMVCQEAIGENEYNINARKYLALAYKEKAETLEEMSESI